MHRVIGTAVLTFIAWQIGSVVGRSSEHPRNAAMGMVTGAVIGFLATPFLVTRPFERVRRIVGAMSAHSLLSAVIGLLLGLLVGALLAFPLSLLPWWLGRLVPLLTAGICAYLGVALMLDRRADIARVFSGHQASTDSTQTSANRFLVDTSAIIDGRIADIVHAGFLHGTLIVPQFVLTELQHIADSPDGLRRQRGRRGLDVLHRLQKETTSPVEILEHDIRHIDHVDSKLVHLAREFGVPVVTNDFNLNRIAELQGVRVLNINLLANALKPIVLPGEEMSVHVIQEGREHGQGLAYLDDGTMIVVEGGKRFLNCNLDIIVTRVLQTSAGRMIFAHPRSLGGLN